MNQSEQSKDTVKSLEERINHNREKAGRWIVLGESYERRGQHERAERAYLRAIQLQPSLMLAPFYKKYHE